MKIDINVHNSSISFPNKNIDLKYTGIYLVTGPNGIGKTTILKNIVFTKHFEDSNRNHFSYVEQDPEKYEISIKDYLHRYNKNVNEKQIDELLKKFKLDYLEKKNSIMNISGGELIKLNIISEIAKDNDFIFLDEPTNNLDNNSINILVKILSEYSINKTIVVVSHDPRLEELEHHNITISKNEINVVYQDKTYQNSAEFISTKKSNQIKYPWLNIILHHFLNPLTIVYILLLIIYSIIFIFVNHMSYQKFYDNEELSTKDGSLLVYSVDEEYGELSSLLAECEKISIDDEKYYSMVKYDSIPLLVNNHSLISTYILDEERLDSILYSNDSSSIQNIMVPDIVRGYSRQFLPIVNNEYIIDGRYPIDEANELMTSQEIIDKYFMGSSIGDKVIFNEKEYLLVGIHALNIIVTSYEEDKNNIIYKYNPLTYEEFVERQIEYKTAIDAPVDRIYRQDIVVLQTSILKEHTLLIDVFKQFPANNYRSYSYDKDLSDYKNEKFLTMLLFVNIGIGIGSGIVFVIINKKKNILYKIKSASIDNYYLLNHVTYKIYGLGDLVILLFIFLFYCLAAYKYATYSYEFLIMILGYGILCIISSIPYWLHDIKRND